MIKISAELKEDPIFGLNKEYLNCQKKNKINLIIGVYINKQGQKKDFQSVSEAKKIINNKSFDNQYLPIEGCKKYINNVNNLILREDIDKKKISTFQTIGGTGALKIAAEFLFKYQQMNTIWIGTPTWENHNSIFQQSGFNIKNYTYYDEKNKTVNHQSIMEELEKHAQPNDILLLHACCQNPTGTDLNPEQWLQLKNICKEKSIIPIFDAAYIGFGGKIDQDTHIINTFIKDLPSVIVCTSFSKNFGLYKERIGALTICYPTEETKINNHNKVSACIRSTYSNPPAYGAEIINTILESEELTNLWQKELSAMRNRIKNIRTSFIERIRQKQNQLNLDYISNQKGLFGFTDLTKQQMIKLREDFGVFGLDSGRINLSSINDDNIEEASTAIAKTISCNNIK